MHLLFKSHKTAPPPIFSLVMAVVFFTLDIVFILRGEVNTGRPGYEYIISLTSDPVAYLLWLAYPLIAGILCIVLAVATYKNNKTLDTISNDEEHK